MAKWEVLNAAEEALVRRMGKDPAPMVVNRVGENSRVFLDLKTREEIYHSGHIGARRVDHGKELEL